VFLRRILPAKAVVIDEDKTVLQASVINAKLAMGLGGRGSWRAV